MTETGGLDLLFGWLTFGAVVGVLFLLLLRHR
jgi:hypothetical protein